LDRAVQSGSTCYYWIEDADIYGHTTYHGPIRVKVAFHDIPLFGPGF
jgi:hypothetical protein